MSKSVTLVCTIVCIYFNLKQIIKYLFVRGFENKHRENNDK